MNFTSAILLLLVIYCHPMIAMEAEQDWFTYYYKNPNPDLFVQEVKAMAKAGVLTRENARPPIVAFLSQVVAANSDRIEEWMGALTELDQDQKKVILTALWYSHADEATAYFKKEQLLEYVNNDAPDILRLEVTHPSVLDMFWGYFMATGEEEPIRRIISAFSLAKYDGAIERYKNSNKTEKDRDEAYLDAAYGAAMWSLKSNCEQHPLVLRHCENIYMAGGLPKDQEATLGVLLTQIAPERFAFESGEDGVGKIICKIPAANPLSDESAKLKKAIMAFRDGMCSENEEERKRALTGILPNKEDLILLFGDDIEAVWPRMQQGRDKMLQSTDKFKQEIEQAGQIKNVELVNIRKNDKSGRYSAIIKAIPKDIPLYRAVIDYETGSAGSSTYLIIKGRVVHIMGLESMHAAIQEAKTD